MDSREAMDKQQEENVKRWRDTMEALFLAVDNQCCQPYSISVVPEELRKVNENAYAPKVVSIGPRYKGRKELQKMEEMKWRLRMSLLSRTKGNPTENLKTCLQVMLKHDAAVRTSYMEEIELDSFNLATIMLYDGCFLLELLISRSDKWNARLRRHSSDPELVILGKMLEMVLSDLTLLDNQIPLFILHQLFSSLFEAENKGANVVPFIEEMTLSLFGHSYSQDQSSIPATHFLELTHHYIFRESRRDPNAVIVDMDLAVDLPKIGNKSIQVKLDRCATRLQAAGVTFKCKANDVTPISHSHGSMLLHLKFEHGVLEIPTLHITETTEAKWRNFIAWEHQKKNWNGTFMGEMFSFSALLFDDLICCASDVQLLRDRGIIVDHLSMSNHKLVDFFRSLTTGLDHGIVDTTYHNLIHDLNKYSVSNCLVQFLVMYWHSYSRLSEWIYGLHKFLKRGYNFAAALVTLLTLVQTIYTVLSYHRPN